MAKKQKFPHLMGSKWTAQTAVMGWRHFQVVNRKNQGALVFAEIVATCDDTVRLWVNAKTLKNRALWTSGWQPLQAQGQIPRHPPASPDQVLNRPTAPTVKTEQSAIGPC